MNKIAMDSVGHIFDAIVEDMQQNKVAYLYYEFDAIEDIDERTHKVENADPKKIKALKHHVTMLFEDVCEVFHDEQLSMLIVKQHNDVTHMIRPDAALDVVHEFVFG